MEIRTVQSRPIAKDTHTNSINTTKPPHSPGSFGRGIPANIAIPTIANVQRIACGQPILGWHIMNWLKIRFDLRIVVLSCMALAGCTS